MASAKYNGFCIICFCAAPSALPCVRELGAAWRAMDHPLMHVRRVVVETLPMLRGGMSDIEEGEYCPCVGGSIFLPCGGGNCGRAVANREEKWRRIEEGRRTTNRMLRGRFVSRRGAAVCSRTASSTDEFARRD